MVHGRNPMQHLKKWIESLVYASSEGLKVQQSPHLHPYLYFTISPLVLLKVNYVSCVPYIHRHTVYVYES